MDKETRIGMTVGYGVSFCVALLGNSLIIHIIRKRPSMKTTTNLLLINMAVADLFIAFTMMPLAIFRNYLRGWFTGTFGDVSCRLVFLASHVPLAGSIITLTVMALERFFAIIYPLRSISCFEKVRLVSFLIWFFSVIIMSPVAVAATVKEVNGTASCERYWALFGEPQLTRQAYYTSTFVLLYLLPLLLMAVLYSAIGLKLWRRQIPGNSTKESRKIMKNSKRQVVRLLVIIVGVFALCWLPMHVTHFIVAFEPSVHANMPYTARFFVFYIGHINSAINPCLCLALNRKFRQAFLGMMFPKEVKGSPRRSGNTCTLRMTDRKTREVQKHLL